MIGFRATGAACAAVAVGALVGACGKEDVRPEQIEGTLPPRLTTCAALAASAVFENGAFRVDGGAPGCPVQNQFCPLDALDGECEANESAYAVCVVSSWRLRCEEVVHPDASVSDAGPDVRDAGDA